MQDIMYLNIRSCENTDIYYYDREIWDKLLLNNVDLKNDHTRFQFQVMRMANTVYPIDV
jgi:hypothetical protein